MAHALIEAQRGGADESEGVLLQRMAAAAESAIQEPARVRLVVVGARVAEAPPRRRDHLGLLGVAPAGGELLERRRVDGRVLDPEARAELLHARGEAGGDLRRGPAALVRLLVDDQAHAMQRARAACATADVDDAAVETALRDAQLAVNSAALQALNFTATVAPVVRWQTVCARELETLARGRLGHAPRGVGLDWEPLT